MKSLTMADLFCGAGGTSEGAIQAASALGYKVSLTAVNHWPVAVATHTANHPDARHLCASLDSLNPRDLFKQGGLDMLWASPECTHHSRARGGKPIHDQSRATAWCVVRWAEALLPPFIAIENVPEFAEWGPLGSNGRPLASRKGETFRAWCAALASLGYAVDHRILCAADYGDPTTRRRLFVQAARGRKGIRWPEPTHAPAEDVLPGFARKPWRSAREIVDWSLPARSIKARPLRPRTMRRIAEGLEKFAGQPFIVTMEHKGSVRDISRPLPTITTARAGAIAVAEPNAFLVEYYGNGRPRNLNDPLPTVTTHDRFAIVLPGPHDVRFRMLQPHELAQGQGFPKSYRFTGTKTEAVKQIGNAVPCGLARAIVTAALSA